MKQRNTIISAIFILLMLSAGSVMGQFWSSNANGIHYNSGFVGIGTSLPNRKLHLQDLETGTVLQIDGTRAGANEGSISTVLLKDMTTGSMFVNTFRLRSGNLEFLQSAFNASTSSWQEFVYFNYSTSKYEVRHSGDTEFKNGGDVLFNNSGGVLINTSYIPSGYHLAVGGKIIAEEVLVELQTAWPDYVFSPDYKLPSISEVNSFIKENNHLPGVPSQTEIAEEGINLGKMNGILLKKIEELTLYVIQQDERIKKLEEQINN